jgi:hypothetical protein
MTGHAPHTHGGTDAPECRTCTGRADQSRSGLAQDWPVGQLAEIDVKIHDHAPMTVLAWFDGHSLWHFIGREGFVRPDGCNKSWVTAVRPLRLVPQDAVTLPVDGDVLRTVAAADLAAARARLRDLVTRIDPKSYAADPGFGVAISRVLAVLTEPAAPAEQCAHSAVAGEDVYPCSESASAEALTSVGYWKPVCDEHAKQYRDLRPRTPESVAAPSVGTPVEPRTQAEIDILGELILRFGSHHRVTEAVRSVVDSAPSAPSVGTWTPAEEVSAGSDETGLQEPADEAECENPRCVQIAATAGDVYCEITGGLLSYPTYDARTILAHASDEVNKLVESETAELTAEVARYWAATQKVAKEARTIVRGPGTLKQHHAGVVEGLSRAGRILAAALGDGE